MDTNADAPLPTGTAAEDLGPRMAAEEPPPPRAVVAPDPPTAAAVPASPAHGPTLAASPPPPSAPPPAAASSGGASAGCVPLGITALVAAGLGALLLLAVLVSNDLLEPPTQLRPSSNPPAATAAAVSATAATAISPATATGPAPARIVEPDATLPVLAGQAGRPAELEDALAALSTEVASLAEELATVTAGNADLNRRLNVLLALEGMSGLGATPLSIEGLRAASGTPTTPTGTATVRATRTATAAPTDTTVPTATVERGTPRPTPTLRIR